MGKATVYNHLGNGLYSILYKQDNSRAKQREAELEDLKAELDTAYYENGGLYDAVQKASLDYAAATQAFNWAIEDWAECAKQLPPCEDHAALMANTKDKGLARIKAATAYTQAKTAAAKNRADYYAAQKEQGFISSTAQTYADGQVIQAWCISLDPENVIPNGTTVGTIETYGAVGDQQGGYLPRKHINIASTDAPAYSCAEHNRVQPASSMGTASWFNAYCQWLNAMANNPKFAVGTVTGKAGSLLNVALYGTTPTGSQPSGYPFGDTAGYAINLANVPVDYLSCHVKAFEVGDRVVVRFGGAARANPSVIGFAENPRKCPDILLEYFASNGTLAGQTAQTVLYGGDGTEVCAIPPEGNYGFSSWSDGELMPCRTDLDNIEDLSVTASWSSTGAWSPALHLLPASWDGEASMTDWTTSDMGSTAYSCTGIANLLSSSAASMGYDWADSFPINVQYNSYQGLRVIFSGEYSGVPSGFDIDMEDGNDWDVVSPYEYHVKTSSEPVVTMEGSTISGFYVDSQIGQYGTLGTYGWNITATGNGSGSGIRYECVTDMPSQFDATHFDALPQRITVIHTATNTRRNYNLVGWVLYDFNPSNLLWAVKYELV